MASNFVVRRGKPTIVKDPDAVLDYTLDLQDWLTDVQDSLVSFVTEAAGVVVDSGSIEGETIVIWVSGGVVGVEGSVVIRFTTTDGRVDDRTLFFKIEER